MLRGLTRPMRRILTGLKHIRQQVSGGHSNSIFRRDTITLIVLSLSIYFFSWTLLWYSRGTFIALFMRCGSRHENIWPHMTGVIFLVELDAIWTIRPFSDTGGLYIACFIASYSRLCSVIYSAERCPVGICTGMCCRSTWSLSAFAWVAGKHNMVLKLLLYTLLLFENILWKCQFALRVHYYSCFIFTIAAESLTVFDIKHHIRWVVHQPLLFKCVRAN